MDLRRDRQRFPVHFQCRFSGPKVGESVGTIIGLSKKGCLLETTKQVYAGMSMTLQIDVPGTESPIHIQKAAVRWNRDGKVGVGFLTVALPAQERLNQLLK